MVAVPVVSSVQPPPVPEISPVSVGRDVWVSTDHSYRCRWVDKRIVCGRLVAEPNPSVWWRRSYAGVFAAERVRGRLVLFVHGENKNTPGETNTVSGDRSCVSTVVDGVYQDCWPDYFAAISMTVNGRDRGPIVWPAAGYLRDGHQASHGVRHPSSIVAGGFVYLFYLDTSRGICVARAPVDNLTFRTWTGRLWARSLPQRQRFSALGPDAQPILGARPSWYFAVARSRDGFVGLEYGGNGTTIWRSRDLLHWERGRTVSLGDYPRPVGPHLAMSTTGSSAEWVRF